MVSNHGISRKQVYQSLFVKLIVQTMTTAMHMNGQPQLRYASYFTFLVNIPKLQHSQ
jgi:hypothetical protein